MSNIYQAQVLRSTDDGAVVEQSTSVYADTELEARVTAAAQLRVTPDKVTVTLIPGVGNPSDDELMAMWAEARRNQTVNTETTGGSAYHG